MNRSTKLFNKNLISIKCENNNCPPQMKYFIKNNNKNLIDISEYGGCKIIDVIFNYSENCSVCGKTLIPIKIKKMKNTKK